MSLDDQLLFAPLSSLSGRRRAAVVALCAVLTFGWSLWTSGLRYAWGLPDVKFYTLMAQNRYDLVPAPFSARPFAPLLAHGMVASLHCSVETAFTVLAMSSVFFALAVVFFLAARTSAPRWVLLLLALAPFWHQVLREAGLPDPLYTALLAGLLLALECEQLFLAAALMFPLMLTRESTSLTVLCFLAAGWRRLRWPQMVVALAGAGAGTLLVRHLNAGSLPNPEHLSGSLYMVGKLVSNTARSLGVLPWSNVYREPCGTPLWQHAVRLGPIRSVGMCGLSAVGPLEISAALLTVFGAIPLLGIALWAMRRSMHGELSFLTRFCLLYGGISVLLAPSLGTWFERLFAYGWPLFLVAVPQVLGMLSQDVATAPRAQGHRSVWGWLLVLAAVILGLSPEPVQPRVQVVLVLLEAGWLSLFFGQIRLRTGGVQQA